MKPPLVVLDVDGVLNTRPGSLDPDKLKLLEYIHASALCCFLLSSSWRKTPRQFERIADALQARGIGLVGMTPDLDAIGRGGLWESKERWVEIEQWLLEHGDRYGNVVILDDLPGMGPLQHLLVCTAPEGLTPYLADVVIHRLSQDKINQEL